MKSNNDNSEGISRRRFLGQASLAAAAFTIVPRHVLGGKGYKAPSDTLNIACIGVGGKGYGDLHSVSTENIVALCDVDEERAAKAFSEFPKAKKYFDFRRMLDKEHKHIDAVTVSTPDHTHAVAAMAAISYGKHVFVQKPLTHTIYEARKLAEAARKKKVITQMGNQGHAGEGARLICEWIWDGAIGDVYEVHAWTNRPIWPQGINVTRPQEIPTTPPTLHWNLWLGPAPWRPYHPAYVPFSWRGWWDFGTGALGDMGAHIMDQPYWALKLEYPESVEATSTPFNNETYPQASIIRYLFPARGNMPPVKLLWFDGGLKPPRPDDLEEGRRMGEKGGGVIFYGTKGKLMCSVYGNNPRLIPESKMKEYKLPPKTIPRSPGIHEEWIQAIKNGTQATSNFDYAARLTETMLLGNIALRMEEQNRILHYDGQNMRFTNSDEANALIKPEFRKGWTLAY
ncbi:MAG: Gfo/Idh/MocA family oxidoreductase [Calditrichaeota bacterium]|nr:Gfo/Idh/MocA family oxidoreductase [Calditrichota bacterium]